MTKRLFLGTRKGLIIYRLHPTGWRYESTHFLGIPVSLAYVDHRNGSWWACLDHGHWGCKLHRSVDEGQNWEKLPAPKYPEGTMIKEGVPAAVRYLWAINGGGVDQANRVWLGTEPGGLFRSDDGGQHFNLVESLWNHPSREEHWFGGGRDYAGIHSIIVDPRDSKHIYVGISIAGVFESFDDGASWQVRNSGLRADYLPDPFAEVGHDPHLLLACPSNPDVLWQQNHCGIFKSTNGGINWQDVTDPNGIARFGFAIAVNDKQADRAWVVPSISDEMRVTIGQSLCVCRTDDGGQSWQEYRTGLPQEACFDIVYRHALAVSDQWVCFGTTTGNLFISADEGESWSALNHYLPMVYSVEFAET